MAVGNGRHVALVTGAARGIGQAIALALGEAGFSLVVNDIEAASLQDTLARLEAAGVPAVACEGDIGDLSRHDALADSAFTRFGSLSCLVNNAGISVARRGDMLEVTPESFDQLMAVNLRGPFFLTQKIAARMIRTPAPGPRTIVSISSANAAAASADRAEYCISKSGLSMMTKLFATRLAAHGINVYEVRPGVIRTGMTAVARERYDARYATGEFTPINRWGEPEEVGRAVAALAANVFGFSTGEVINVDGGMHIPRL